MPVTDKNVLWTSCEWTMHRAMNPELFVVVFLFVKLEDDLSAARRLMNLGRDHFTVSFGTASTTLLQIRTSPGFSARVSVFMTTGWQTTARKMPRFGRIIIIIVNHTLNPCGIVLTCACLSAIEAISLFEDR